MGWLFDFLVSTHLSRFRDFTRCPRLSHAVPSRHQVEAAMQQLLRECRLQEADLLAENRWKEAQFFSVRKSGEDLEIWISKKRTWGFTMIYWYWNILKYIVDRWIFSNSKNRRGHSYKGTMNRGNPLEVSSSIILLRSVDLHEKSHGKIPRLGFPVLGLKKTQLINFWRLDKNPWIDQATRFFLNWVKTTCDAFAVNIYLLSRWHHGCLSEGVNCTFLWLYNHQSSCSLSTRPYLGV